MTETVTKPSRSFFTDRPFQVDVVGIFVAMLLGAVLSVAFYTYYRNAAATLNVSNNLLDTVSEAVIEKTVNYLAPAHELSKITADMLAGKDADLTRDADLERYLISLMKTYPQFAMFYIGDAEGDFLMVNRQPDGTLATQRIDRNGSEVKQTWLYRDKNGADLRTETSTNVSYDPRARPWYKGANNKPGQVFWTDIYVFFTGRKPGITAACAVPSKTGVRAVVGADIELDQLSAFLKSQRIGTNGFGFILDGENRVVAYPDASKIVTMEGEKLRPVLAGEMDDPALVHAAQDLTNRDDSSAWVFELDGKRQMTRFTPMPTGFGRDWIFGIVVPEDDFIGPIRQAHMTSLLISALILIVALACAVYLSRSLSRPIEQLTTETQKIREFRLDETVPVHSHIREVQQMSDAIVSMKAGLTAFRKYVPDDLVRQLIETGEEAALGGAERELTLFFSDIRGFTMLSEKVPAADLMPHLSSYLEEMTNIIRINKGTIDKYIGDGIMAFWGAPRDDEHHALNAARAAVQCQSMLKRMNHDWPLQGLPALPTRIALHTGPATVGNVGSSDRMSYSALGDAVNLASRLEPLNKLYGTWTLVSRATGRLIENEMVLRPLDIVAVAGKEEGVRIYELVCEKNDNCAEVEAAFASEFTQAVNAYQNRDWKGALALFQNLSRKRPEDRACRIYIERCGMTLSENPGPDWSPVLRLDEKKM